MNKTIFRFTLMSACLDPIKLIYVALLGFVVPVGMKIAFVLHGAAESQTFEMLTGKAGVAFVLMVLCLGLAGNSATQSGRGGEYLPLLFTRPLSRQSYVLTKWVTITLIGGALAVMQNVSIAAIGAVNGENISMVALASMVIERFMDAAMISAAMLLVMLNKNRLFQVAAGICGYIWLVGQTVPPVSVAGARPSGVDELALDATRLLLSSSEFVGDVILPTVNVYDLLNAQELSFLPIVAYLSTLFIYLALAVLVINKREFFYGTT